MTIDARDAIHNLISKGLAFEGEYKLSLGDVRGLAEILREMDHLGAEQVEYEAEASLTKKLLADSEKSIADLTKTIEGKDYQCYLYTGDSVVQRVSCGASSCKRYTKDVKEVSCTLCLHQLLSQARYEYVSCSNKLDAVETDLGDLSNALNEYLDPEVMEWDDDVDRWNALVAPKFSRIAKGD